MQRISVIGLGKLGSSFLATCASRGFEVIGVEKNPAVVSLINQGKPPVNETGLGDLLAKNLHKIKTTTDYSVAVNNSDITFIIVSTPSLKSGAFSNKYVIESAKSVAKILAKKDKYHLVVVVSTISPGSMNKVVVPLLEKYSGKKVSKDFGVCHNPEFIALGSVINDLLNPDFVMIGESDVKAGKYLASFYKKFCLNKPPIVRMQFINAEITKLALNSYITTKISFANTLAQICERTPGGNIDQVTTALGHDSRINSKYLKGGLPYGGPCFPRDNHAFIHFAKKLKVDAPIAKATDKVNENLIKALSKETSSLVNSKSKVAILGLAYKKDTDVAEESAGVRIANSLAKGGIKVFVYDPKAMSNATKILSSKVSKSNSIKDCVSEANVVMITTPWEEFKALNVKDLMIGKKKTVLFDCWQILDSQKYQKVADYRTIGIEGINISKASLQVSTASLRVSKPAAS